MPCLLLLSHALSSFHSPGLHACRVAPSASPAEIAERRAGIPATANKPRRPVRSAWVPSSRVPNSTHPPPHCPLSRGMPASTASSQGWVQSRPGASSQEPHKSPARSGKGACVGDNSRTEVPLGPYSPAPVPYLLNSRSRPPHLRMLTRLGGSPQQHPRPMFVQLARGWGLSQTRPFPRPLPLCRGDTNSSA